MSDIIYMAVMVTGWLLVALFLLRKRFSLSPRRMMLPFVEFDVLDFRALTVVRLFENVTLIRLPPQIFQDTSDTMHPLMLMNAGWMMVCDAFVTRFNIYPTDENVRSVVSEIGPQNAEFLITFRSVYEAAIKEGDRIERHFAESFLTRSPALSQRILRDNTPLPVFAAHQYAKWQVKDC